MKVSEDQAWIAMNDGVRLDATVCTPAGAPPSGRWPGVLLVHGHGDTASKVSCLPRARRLAARGYVAVAYSVRGQGASEGLSFHMGPREVYDLQDVVAWTLAEAGVHPERLGVAGSSQGGWHSWMAAIHCPQVATVVPENIFTDYADFAVRDGCLTKWFFLRTMRRRIMSAGFQELARQWAETGDWHLLRAWLQDRSPLTFVDRVRCPVLIVHGWHDVGMPPNEVLTAFERLSVPKKLYLGGGGHDGQDDESAQRLREDLVDRWLDHWLQDRDTGLLAEPPITCARRPGWDHVGVDAIPAADSEARVLYLAGSGVPLQPGRLDAAAPDGPRAPSNVHNAPADPDYGLRQALRDDLAGVEAALPREEIVFDDEVLARDLEILGAAVARLHLLPNHPEFQVHVEIHDVGEAGSTLIARGHRGWRDAAPGRHVVVDVELAAIHYRVAAGHRLRVVVANRNETFTVPMFAPSCTRLFHDVERPSSLTLPLRRAP